MATFDPSESMNKILDELWNIQNYARKNGLDDYAKDIGNARKCLAGMVDVVPKERYSR